MRVCVALAFGVVIVPEIDHSNGGVSHCCALHFLDYIQMWYIFSYAYLPSVYIFFAEVCSSIWTVFNQEVYFFIFNFILVFFRAAPMAYGSSLVRSQIGATAAGLHHSHSNAVSKAHLRPTPQLTAMQDP